MLVAQAGFPVGVEEAGLGDKDRPSIKDRGLKKIAQSGVIFRVGLDSGSMNGELKVRGGKSEGELRVVANSEGLVERVG